MKTAQVRSAQVELWRYPLHRPVGGSGVTSVDIVVVGMEDGDGRTAMGFSYVLAGSGESAVAAARYMLNSNVLNQPALHPEALHRRVRASLSRSGKGFSYIGLAAVDVAAWDLYAKQLDVPLGVAMGGAPRAIPVYGSGGYRAGQDPEEAAEQTRRYLQRGLTAVKLRVDGSPADLRVLARVREQIADSAFMAIDANEKCSAASASWLMQVAQEYRLLFVEEPLPARDLSGYLALQRAAHVAVATGEHLQGLDEAAPFLADGLCQLMQPDLSMMGGLTECLRTARVAEGLGIDIAPHFLPSLFVHLAAAAPNVTWLEDFPLLEPLFAGLPEYDRNGRLSMPLAPGHGLSWAAGAKAEFLAIGASS